MPIHPVSLIHFCVCLQLCLGKIIDYEKSRYFAQPRPVIFLSFMMMLLSSKSMYLFHLMDKDVFELNFTRLVATFLNYHCAKMTNLIISLCLCFVLPKSILLYRICQNSLATLRSFIVRSKRVYNFLCSILPGIKTRPLNIFING